MIETIEQLRVTMRQMDRVIRALEDLRQDVLPRNPNLFATLAEAPLEDLSRLRVATSDYTRDLKPVG